jgi:hypothetical protein
MRRDVRPILLLNDDSFTLLNAELKDKSHEVLIYEEADSDREDGDNISYNLSMWTCYLFAYLLIDGLFNNRKTTIITITLSNVPVGS